MENPDITKIIDEGNHENRYRFVVAVGKRATRLNGDKKLRERLGVEDENVVSFALNEFTQKKLFMTDKKPNKATEGASESAEEASAQGEE